MSRYRARMAVAEDGARLAALFDACACACHCRYWFFEGTKNDWLARCAFDADENRKELLQELASEPLTGLVAEALEQGDASREASDAASSSGAPLVGWMRVTERARVPRLRNLPVYKMLDLGEDEGIASIGCVLVHPEHRGRGVARALVRAATELVGATHHLEAYPRRPMEAQRLGDEEAWLGPERLYVEEGFALLPAPAARGPFSASTDTYPIYRRTAGPPNR